jgi:hypothetical protein
MSGLGQFSSMGSSGVRLVTDDGVYPRGVAASSLLIRDAAGEDPKFKVDGVVVVGSTGGGANDWDFTMLGVYHWPTQKSATRAAIINAVTLKNVR